MIKKAPDPMARVQAQSKILHLHFNRKDVICQVKVLAACEESQRVCTAFRETGHEAYSCDVQEPSGGHPEWHILGDALEIINGRTTFRTIDGTVHEVTGRWDLIIAHPPCTYLSVVGNKYFNIEKYGQKALARWQSRIEAAVFFVDIMNAHCDRICVENPVGFMNSNYRKPDQIIHPYMFAESADDAENYVTKATCLWLKGLPMLTCGNLQKPDNEKMYGRNPNGKVSNWEERCTGSDRAKARSKTFTGIARAMAEQWGKWLQQEVSKNA